MRAEHEFGPFYDSDSEILILGSFPSVKSRERAFYYAHPQNRFWRVLAEIFGCGVPTTTEEKKSMLAVRRIALWDVIESCEIDGSSDASIREATPTDLEWLLAQTRVRRIILNGKTAARYFRRFHGEIADTVDVVTAPSTSPANASWSADRLVGEWRRALFGADQA